MDTSKDISFPTFMSEKEWLDIHALADNQLDLNLKESLLLKLTQDRRGFNEYLSVVKIKQILQKCTPFQPHFLLWQQIEQDMNRFDKQRYHKTITKKLWWLLPAALLLLIIFAGFYYRSHTHNSLDIRKLASSPISFAPITPSQYQTQNSFQSWMDHLLGKHLFKVPSEMKLIKAETGMFNRKRAFQFELKDVQGAFSLLVIDNVAAIYGFHREIGHKNFGYFFMNHRPNIVWMQHHDALILSGKRSITDLEVIASKLKKSD